MFVVVVDRDRNAVAFINSIFEDFGCGIASPTTGIIFHNRASGFVLERGHPNAIAGRKRPLHTIIPAMLTRNGKAVMPFGVTGGHFQPFGQVQILSNILDRGMGVQAAIDSPRLFATGDRVECESTMPSALVQGLAARGHNVVPAPNPLGTAQAIWIDWEHGILAARRWPPRRYCGGLVTWQCSTPPVSAIRKSAPRSLARYDEGRPGFSSLAGFSCC